MLSCLMKYSISKVVLIVRIKGCSSLAMLKKIDGCFEMIVLCTHKQNILSLPTLNLHIGSILLQKHHHVDIAMQGCKMESRESIRILMIDPCSQLTFECWLVTIAPAVLPTKSFIMQYINLHLGELVFECCEV